MLYTKREQKRCKVAIDLLSMVEHKVVKPWNTKERKGFPDTLHPTADKIPKKETRTERA